MDQSAKKIALITPLGWLAYALAGLVVVVDQLVKAWVVGPFDLPAKGSVEILPIFRLTMVWNPGVSFGLLRADSELGRWLLVAFAAAVVVALAAWVRQAATALTAIGVGLVIGGAIGNNVIDRVRFGAVEDFLDFTDLGFKWVFNVADSAITVGVAIMLLELVIASRPAKPARDA